MTWSVVDDAAMAGEVCNAEAAETRVAAKTSESAKKRVKVLTGITRTQGSGKYHHSRVKPAHFTGVPPVETQHAASLRSPDRSAVAKSRSSFPTRISSGNRENNSEFWLGLG
jgi:hypothetical protein